MTQKKSPFGFEKPESSPGFLLWQTLTIWQRLIKRQLEEYRLNHTQFVILAIAYWFSTKDNIAKQTDIITLSKLEKMTVSKSLKSLASLNLIQRSENQSDSRFKNIILTDEGEKLIKLLIPMVEKVDNDFFNTLTKNENDIIKDCFKKLSHFQSIDNSF
ncbi:MarR family transcriptional regulator [Pigmentibacter sp. JX0631]|uniref:MarR family winged helix-turn-helix transcriptional regulator n=1 Tax=Pigmentibacter sp. JX0631 TaxID=2976982 RepID=UPI0024687BDB|nr:MarR family transcriptional regulator [Pigmentibacter sp. JX0631]WGL59802.1 MarR family transcriptional regulator [Pigmentibacter sp. JX0631]